MFLLLQQCVFLCLYRDLVQFTIQINKCTKYIHIYIYLYLFIISILNKQNRSIRLPEDVADALKCVGGVLTIYIYIYICVCVCVCVCARACACVCVMCICWSG